MFTRSKYSHVSFSIIVILTLILSGISPVITQVQAQSGEDDGRRQVGAQKGGDGIRREVNPQSGRVSFIGPESGRVLPSSKALGTFIRPQDPGRALLDRFAPEFGIKDPGRELSEMQSSRPGDGRMTVRYQQMYEGIPVMGGELVVNTNRNGDLYSMNGEVSPDLSLQTQPTIDSAQAAETALQEIATQYEKETADFVASEPELWIYDESLLKPSTRSVELVWRMEVTSANNMPIRELVLVDAHLGGVSLHFNQVDMAWSSARDVQTLKSAESVISSTTLNRTVSGNDDSTTQSRGEFMPNLAGASWYVATTGDDTDDCATTSTPCATINSAIGKATAGDTVYVATGIYTGSGTEVVLVDKDITLSGGWNAGFTTQGENSTIDGQNNRGCISVLESVVTANIEYFTLVNGDRFDGAGIHNRSGNLTLDQIIASNNSAWGNFGGGIYNQDGNLTINNSIIHDNSATYGGGVYNIYGNVTLYATIISGNSAANGGGINNMAGGSLTLINTTVNNNSGGGIRNPNYSSIFIENSTISNNSTGTNGGGIYNYGGSVTLNNTTISNNSAATSGGGIYIGSSGSLILNNTTISSNSASVAGGIYNYGSDNVSLQNSLLGSNIAARRLF